MRAFAKIIATLILPAACGLFSPAWADGPRVVASIKPLQSLAAGVMAGVGEPALLIKGSASAHAYALRPSDAAMLDDAEIVFWIGPVFETFLESPLAALAGKAHVVRLMTAPGLKALPSRKTGLWENSEDNHASTRQLDGHIWLDSGNAKVIVSEMARILAMHDPRNATRYRTNAAEIEQRLNALGAELRATLAPVKQKPFVVFHDAYQYFEAEYGLHAAGAITVGPERAPGARRLNDIRKTVVGAGPVCIFAEPQFEPKLVPMLAADTAAKTGVLDPEGSILAPGPDLYFNLLRILAANLVRCLSAP